MNYDELIHLFIILMVTIAPLLFTAPLPPYYVPLIATHVVSVAQFKVTEIKALLDSSKTSESGFDVRNASAPYHHPPDRGPEVLREFRQVFALLASLAKLVEKPPASMWINHHKATCPLPYLFVFLVPDPVEWVRNCGLRIKLRAVRAGQFDGLNSLDRQGQRRSLDDLK
ncbi:hypothetical protein Btru_073748 [Bulinus truncatus]|nr:hypothetical protein Btru_073748 [Bulinus truncatus]